jgi:hypothetical protein
MQPHRTGRLPWRCMPPQVHTTDTIYYTIYTIYYILYTTHILTPLSIIYYYTYILLYTTHHSAQVEQCTTVCTRHTGTDTGPVGTAADTASTAGAGTRTGTSTGTGTGTGMSKYINI